MKFLALETDVGKIQDMFLIEGEEQLLCTCHHIFAFLIPLLVNTLLMAAIITVGTFFFLASPDSIPLGLAGTLLGVCILIYLYQFLLAYIQWRFNFIIVTTTKVIIVDQHSFLYSNTLPIHLDNISSTISESQFYGIGNCGRLHIHLKERRAGSTSDVMRPYVPSSDAVVGIIENAISFITQRQAEGEGKEEQQPKIEAVKRKAEEVKGVLPPPVTEENSAVQQVLPR